MFKHSFVWNQRLASWLLSLNSQFFRHSQQRAYGIVLSFMYSFNQSTNKYLLRAHHVPGREWYSLMETALPWWTVQCKGKDKLGKKVTVWWVARERSEALGAEGHRRHPASMMHWMRFEGWERVGRYAGGVKTWRQEWGGCRGAVQHVPFVPCVLCTV